MADTDFQRDFFDGELKATNARKGRFLRRYSEQRHLSYLRIPIEYTVIIFIGVLVLIIVSYAVGVEKGRRSVHVDPAKAQISLIETGDITQGGITVSDVADHSVEKEDPIETSAEPVIEVRETPDTSKVESTRAEEPPKGAYVIQLASFKKGSSARAEVRKLKRKGVSAEIARKGEWYQVYASGYQNIDEARRAQHALVEDYEDCYIRKIK